MTMSPAERHHQETAAAVHAERVRAADEATAIEWEAREDDRRNTVGIIQALTPHVAGETNTQREAAAAAELRKWEAEARDEDHRDQLEAEANAEAIAIELRAVLAGERTLDEYGDFVPLREEPDRHACEDDEAEECPACEFEEDEPATLVDWLENVLDVEVLYDREGAAQRVTVGITYGGPTVYTEEDRVRWGHGRAVGFAHVTGLHEALLELADEGIL